MKKLLDRQSGCQRPDYQEVICFKTPARFQVKLKLNNAVNICIISFNSKRFKMGVVNNRTQLTGLNNVLNDIKTTGLGVFFALNSPRTKNVNFE